MLALLAQIFVGWPSFFGSLFISLLGIYYKRPYYLVIGSLLSVGFAWYITGFPLLFFDIMGHFLPLSHLLALLFLRINKRWGFYLVGLTYGIVYVSFLLIPLIYGG